MAMKKNMLWYPVFMILAACSEMKTGNTEKEGVETVLPQQVNEVTVMKLEKRDFHHELMSNGMSSI